MIATASAVAFVVYSCKGKIQQSDDVDFSAAPVQIVRNMFVVQTENSLLQLRMEADLMERYENDSVSYELFPEGFAVYGYNEEGLLETEITSDNARHEKFEKDDLETWAAFGNVVVKNVINRERMETDTLYWDRKNERIYTDCYVRMYSPDGFMQGYGMESDQRARNSSIFNPFDSYGIVIQDSTKVAVDSANFIGPFPEK
ncbi:MAG: LPS export ABC transporter periplasmic protein LptC [Bacteroidetes bacterium]|jgi:LPS export ABC transporter protein LptC|uniref:LPS export ABC transporter periplasmic protein LptC n=1 Tax=Candidatus Cryptobacteroides avicola TaxID=2840757 RepID=A0A940II43_9BACT|nr:LPS export ABC transporter periplasmic protein LptC [Candidatus Cryptobacteroides avicola]